MSPSPSWPRQRLTLASVPPTSCGNTDTAISSGSSAGPARNVASRIVRAPGDRVQPSGVCQSISGPSPLGSAAAAGVGADPPPIVAVGIVAAGSDEPLGSLGAL